jgi:hypothetical protein
MVGRQQRLELMRQRDATSAAAVDGAPPVGASHLVSLLTYFWAWGHMSPQILQQICAAVDKDLGIMSGGDLAGMARALQDEVSSAADLGSHGRYPSNCNRGLRQFMGRSLITGSMFDVPLRTVGSAVGALGTTVAQCMLLPHVMFAAVGNHFPNAFRKVICPSRERLVEFWSNVADSPQLKGQGSGKEGYVCLFTQTRV